MNLYDFNDAGTQRNFDVIPANTLCTVQMNIKPGGVGPDGCLTAADTSLGHSENLVCEFTVIDGEYTKRKIFARYTLTGQNHAESIRISRQTLRAMLDAANGLDPKDKSEATEAKRRIASLRDFDFLRFDVIVGVDPPNKGYQAKNKILEIVVPGHAHWKQIQQLDRNTASVTSPTPSPTPSAGAIARPAWAQPLKKQDDSTE